MMADTDVPPTPVADLPEVLQFMRLVWALTQSLERRSRQMQRTIGVTGPQRLVLRIIGLTPGTSAGSVAQILHVHPSTLTGTLTRLVARRLVRRTRDPDDRRRARLHLTARGARIDRRTAGTVEVAMAAALTRVSGADRRATRRVLERLTSSLNPGRPWSGGKATGPGAAVRAQPGGATFVRVASFDS